MRIIFNRLILLLFFFAIIGVVKSILLLLRSRPLAAIDFIEAFAAGVVFWIVFLVFGKGMLKDWPFKDSQ